MKLQEKLKLYQETLKKDEPTNAFNPGLSFSIPFITSTMMFLSANFLPIFSPRRYCLSCSCS